MMINNSHIEDFIEYLKEKIETTTSFKEYKEIRDDINVCQALLNETEGDYTSLENVEEKVKRPFSLSNKVIFSDDYKTAQINTDVGQAIFDFDNYKLTVQQYDVNSKEPKQVEIDLVKTLSGWMFENWILTEEAVYILIDRNDPSNYLKIDYSILKQIPQFKRLTNSNYLNGSIFTIHYRKDLPHRDPNEGPAIKVFDEAGNLIQESFIVEGQELDKEKVEKYMEEIQVKPKEKFKVKRVEPTAASMKAERESDPDYQRSREEKLTATKIIARWKRGQVSASDTLLALQNITPGENEAWHCTIDGQYATFREWVERIEASQIELELPGETEPTWLQTIGAAIGTSFMLGLLKPFKNNKKQKEANVVVKEQRLVTCAPTRENECVKG